MARTPLLFFFFLNDPATTEISTLPLHDALPISFGQPPDCPPLTGSSHMTFQASADGGKSWGPPRSIACQPEFGADAQLAVTTLANGVHRRSEEHTSELQSQSNLVCRLLLEKKNT